MSTYSHTSLVINRFWRSWCKTWNAETSTCPVSLKTDYIPIIMFHYYTIRQAWRSA